MLKKSLLLIAIITLNTNINAGLLSMFAWGGLTATTGTWATQNARSLKIITKNKKEKPSEFDENIFPCATWFVITGALTIYCGKNLCKNIDDLLDVSTSLKSLFKYLSKILPKKLPTSPTG